MSLPGSDREWRPKDGQPHGWIQWKGTDVCMDVHCKCGLLGHIDADFAYFVRCQRCNTVYKCNGHIELVELNIEEAKEALTGAYVNVPYEPDDEEG